MCILDIEDGIVFGLLDHLGEVEIQRRVILAIKHHEAHGIAADFFDDFAQGDEIARSAPEGLKRRALETLV